MARSKVFDEQQVLEKAMKLFWQKGYNATSAQDLVEGLGISRSSMYDTFGDKHSLYVSALKQYRKERIDPYLNGVDSAEDIEEYIKSVFFASINDVLNEEHVKGCFMVNSAIELATADSEVANIAYSIMRDTENALIKAIEKGQQQGVFTKKQSSRALARFIFNALNGIRVTVKLADDKVLLEEIVAVNLQALKD